MEKNYRLDYETVAEVVYDILMGDRVEHPSIIPVENLFEEGSTCERLYSEIFDANERLCQRLGVQGEDEDVEMIIGSFFTMMRIVGERMFYYGGKI